MAIYIRVGHHLRINYGLWVNSACAYPESEGRPPNTRPTCLWLYWYYNWVRYWNAELWFCYI